MLVEGGAADVAGVADDFYGAGGLLVQVFSELFEVIVNCRIFLGYCSTVVKLNLTG